MEKSRRCVPFLEQPPSRDSAPRRWPERRRLSSERGEERGSRNHERVQGTRHHVARINDSRPRRRYEARKHFPFFSPPSSARSPWPITIPRSSRRRKDSARCPQANRFWDIRCRRAIQINFI